MSDLPSNTINAEFTVCPQIQVSDVAKIKALGFKTIMNNRPDGEAPDQPLNDSIAREAKNLGVDYIFHPVVGSNITAENVAKMSECLASAQKPVFAFCRSGARCTMLYNLAQGK